jgi:hypothetical protein
MVNTLASVGKDISTAKPELYAAYHVITDAAQRNQ